MQQTGGLALLASSLVTLCLLAPAPARATGPLEIEVPFACGSRVVVSQGHGTFSHVGTDRWAWDFRVPEGTPVYAARDGMVRMVRSDSVRGGCDRSFGPDANYVIISHGNDLETQYLHFSRVFVRPGQQVRAGTVIGEVGRTGFSCGAHLHFQVQNTRENAWANQSVPARFREIGDPDANQEIVSMNCRVPEPGEADVLRVEADPAGRPSPAAPAPMPATEVEPLQAGAGRASQPAEGAPAIPASAGASGM